MPVNEERLKELFVSMVDTYSPSGKEEAVLELLEEHASGLGVPYLRQRVDDTRYNLIVGQPLCDTETLLVGHVDTVPAFDLERYETSWEGGDVHGLGSADMKSGCAAMLEAYGAYVEDQGHLPSASLCLVVGEEETGDGSQALVEEWSGSQVFVAEPTALKVAASHFGYAEVELLAVGERRHAAMANRERNAIYALLRALLELSDAAERDYPRLTLNIRDVHSSEAGFAVADRCRAVVDLHIPPDLPFLEVVHALVAHVREQASEPEHLSLEILMADPGWVLDPAAPVVKLSQAACAACGQTWQADAFRSHSDASIFTRAGASVVLYGPGQIAKAHTRRESVPWAQVVDAARFYRALLGELQEG